MASVGGGVAEDDWNDSELGRQFCGIDGTGLMLKLTLLGPSDYADFDSEDASTNCRWIF